jgi:hypothetical protein
MTLLTPRPRKNVLRGVISSARHILFIISYVNFYLIISSTVVV